VLQGDRKGRTHSPRPTVIAIVGLGFIGGSIGLTLRQQGRPIRIIGHDRDPARGKQARQLGAIDRAEWNLLRACEEADIVILALPPDGIRDTLRALTAKLKPGCLVTDTATVKGVVLRWAEELLPPQVAFVGGDPIVRSPGHGLEQARADLFQDQIYCLTPASDVPPAAVHQATELVQSLGAQPYFLDADEHDGLRAAVEHLPALLIALLLREAAHSPTAQEMGRLTGQLLIGASSLMSEETATYRALCLANSSAIIRWSRIIRRRLLELEQLIEAHDEEGLTALFEEAFGVKDAEAEPEQPHPSLWRQWLGLGR